MGGGVGEGEGKEGVRLNEADEFKKGGDYSVVYLAGKRILYVCLRFYI